MSKIQDVRRHSSLSTDHSHLDSSVNEKAQDASAPIDIENNELSRESTEPEWLPTNKVVVIMLCIYLTLLLTSLDRMIIGTAIPTITDEFHSLNDVGWYASSYLLTACSFALFYGRIYTFYNPKWVYLSGVVIFEIGSVVSGAAPNSTAFIIGRAIGGLGNAAVFPGAMVIITRIMPLHKRPMWTGFAGMVFGVSSVVGPVLGGAFTQDISWRWCFYINLPIGAVVIAALLFFLRIPEQNFQRESTTWRQKLDRLDWPGTSVFVPALVCLLLALQWGGVTYSWSNWRIILLLVLFAVLFMVFVVIQKFQRDNATVPGRIIFHRSILAGFWFSFFNGASMISVVYFLPIYFQAIKSADAVNSGLMIIPTVLGMVVGTITAGIATRKLGYYTPWMIVSVILAPIGVGLLTTLKPDTNHASWIGFQVIYGLGLGAGMQQPNVAAQTVLNRKDIATGASLMFFSQTLGGTVFVSVANNIFDAQLIKRLAAIQGLTNVKQIVSVGATEIVRIVPVDLLSQVRLAYNGAIIGALYVAVGATCATVFGAALMEWRSVKETPKKAAPAVNEAAATPTTTEKADVEA